MNPQEVVGAVHLPEPHGFEGSWEQHPSAIWVCPYQGCGGCSRRPRRDVSTGGTPDRSSAYSSVSVGTE